MTDGWQVRARCSSANGRSPLLSALVGIEREIRQKSAGLRTYSLVGVSAALFMLISKYGFDNVLLPGRVVLDPSRVAAQIVSGIGFIGGGVIFMRRNVVRGLTTAASVWLTAALGMACGAGLLVLAVATTIGHFLIMYVFPKLIARYLPKSRRSSARLRVVYEEGEGRLAGILVTCSEMRFAIDRIEISRDEASADVEDGTIVDEPSDTLEPVTAGHRRRAVMSLHVQGKRPVPDLIARLSEQDGIAQIATLPRPDVVHESDFQKNG